MNPLYRHGEPYPHFSPAYYSAPPSLKPVPDWEPREPYYYYREAPPWRPWPDEGSSYWYRPAEDGYYYYGPKHGNPRYYERDSRGFGREFGREFSRDFRPVYVPFPSSPAVGAYDYRPFHPSDQFRHPDEYPMRFMPVTYGSLHRPEIEQAKPHCCGCPNHECYPEKMVVKEIEPERLTNENSEEDLIAKSQRLQEFPGSIVWFPSEWRKKASDSKDENEEKYPLYWVPVNCNRNDREPDQEKRCPGYCIPLDSKPSPHGTGEDKNKFPAYWIPVDSSLRSQGQEEDKKNSSNERKMQSFPVICVPGRDLKIPNSQEETKSVYSAVNPEKEAKKTNGADSRPVIVQEDEKQGPVEARKETKARDIPVKQLHDEKLAEAPKIEEKVRESHKASSPRASKLPPVCLRVDPLPKKKSNGNNSSRSLSPPGKAGSTKDNATSKIEGNATSKASVEILKRDDSEVSMELKKPTENANLKPSKVASQTKKIEKNGITKASDVSGEPNKVEEDASLKTSKPASEAKNGENINVHNKKAGVKKSEFDREQAALKIQAFYRGFQVRRLQPMRKLREIAKIRERLEDLTQKISRPEFLLDITRDDKTKVRMSGTLMGLLLQLDTIQGLHPVIRDVRKSVARQLVHLQEKLDTLVKEASTGNLEPSSRELAENDLQPSSRELAENNVTVEEEKIEDQDKSLEATQDAGNTLLNTNSENQQAENETMKSDENSQEVALLKNDSPQIENEMSNGDKVKVCPEQEVDGKEKVFSELENATTKFGRHVEDKVPLKQEALEVSNNLEIPTLSMDLQKEEIGNQVEDPANEREIGTSITQEHIISTANDSEVSLESITVEKEETSEPCLQKGEKSEHNNLREPDSALPQELESAVGKKIRPAPTLVQEPAVTEVENSNTLHENMNASDEVATLKQGEELVVAVPEAEPEKGNSKEKTVVYDVKGNRTENEEQNNVREEIVGDNNLELSLQAISDGLCCLDSDVIEETNLVEVDTLPVSENSSETGEFAAAVPQETNIPRTDESTDAAIPGDSREKGEFAAAAAQETCIPRTDGITYVAITGDGFSARKGKNDLSIQNEEHPPKCSALSDNVDSRASGMVDKLVVESESTTLNKIDYVHTENACESEGNISKVEKAQDRENWEEENETLREMVEKLVAAGENQMSTIAQLNDKIRSLENKLSKGKGKRKTRAVKLKLKSQKVARNTNSATALGCKCQSISS